MDLKRQTAATALPDDLEGWLQQREQHFSDIRPDASKRIVWADPSHEKTPLSVVYLHGFSATRHEIRPVAEKVAAALGANLFFTRLAGHGRSGAAMAEASADDWIADLAEAMAIGRRIGGRVIVIGTSTGAALAAFGATDPDLSDGLAGTVLISPNFGLNSRFAWILDLPFIRWWGPILAGPERGFTPVNADHARYWTTRYPTKALFTMQALVRRARRADFAQAMTPALFIYSADDRVIDPDRISPVVSRWGGPTQVEMRSLSPGDDPYMHILAGDILSPSQTDAVTEVIASWARGLLDG
jgi:esterase/lipase